MKVVLLGAGASFGSGRVEPFSPPLGDQLYSTLSVLFPGSWGGVPSEVKSQFHENFELGMAALLTKYGPATGPLMQEMARFFSRFHLGNSPEKNLYSRLISTIRNAGKLGEIVIASLNYDCLLELACTANKVSVRYFGEPGPDIADALVWKLHGSCNFYNSGVDISRAVTVSYPLVSFGGNIGVLQPGEVEGRFAGDSGMPPVMCLYARSKPVFTATGAIKSAQSRWGELVEQAEAICVVGVNHSPEDDHIWGPIARCRGPFLSIGGQRSLRRWAESERAGKMSKVLPGPWRDKEGTLTTALI